jgi:hypothetical protein
MKISSSIIAALLASRGNLKLPGASKTPPDPAVDGPKLKNITDACTNIFKQPNANPKTVPFSI